MSTTSNRFFIVYYNLSISIKRGEIYGEYGPYTGEASQPISYQFGIRWKDLKRYSAIYENNN